MSNQPKLCEYFISSEVWSESSQLRVYDFAWVNVFHGESGGQDTMAQKGRPSLLGMQSCEMFPFVSPE